MKKLSLSARSKMATILTWMFAGLACSPLLFSVYHLVSASPAPTRDDEYLAISGWFFTWGSALTMLLLLGFVHALNWRRALQSCLPKLENGDAKRAA